MRYWYVPVPADRYGVERLYAHDTVDVAIAGGMAVGDRTVLVATTTPPVVFALGEVTAVEAPGHGAVIAYTQRFFDDPRPAGDLASIDGPTVLDADAFGSFVRPTVVVGPARTWLVSLDLPIEADGPAEAVRQFWSYVQCLGPSELPAFVSPSDDELAMRAFVLGVEANLDPEEDE